MLRKPDFDKLYGSSDTNRDENTGVPIGVRVAVVATMEFLSAEEEAKKWPGLDAATVQQIRDHAQATAARTRSGNTRGVPVADASNLKDEPISAGKEVA